MGDNLKIITNSINQRKKEVDEIKTSVEVTDNTLLKQEKAISNIQTKIKKINNHEEVIKSLTTEINMLKEKAVDLENGSRRKNLRIDGLKEHEKETWDEFESKIKALFKEKLGIDQNVLIERAHRIGKGDVTRKRPRTVIFKLSNFKDKDIILKNAKKLAGTGIFINEDYGGGVCIFVHDSIVYKLRNDLCINNEDTEAMSIEIIYKNRKNIILTNLYRPPDGNAETFLYFTKEVITKMSNKTSYFTGDFNLNILDYDTNKKVNNFFNLMFRYNLQE